MTINLKDYGLTAAVTALADTTSDQLARVTAQHRDQYQVMTAQGLVAAQVTGKLRHQLTLPSAFPAVGDWVLMTVTPDQQLAMIQQVLPRHSVLARGAAGTREADQIIAANVDTIFICMSLNANFNSHRLERYLTLAWDSGAVPVVVLTKADICDDVAAKLAELADVTVGVDVHTCSAETGDGVTELKQYLTGQRTVSFIGSSGVGKSTLINALLSRNVMTTQTIREGDDKGRHTTTSRDLLLVPTGGVVIDTPGMRELQVPSGDLTRAFADITDLATHCKFRNCRHQTEPGCAVQAAIRAGTLTADRLASYQKLQREMRYDGLSARQRENEKIKQWFGGKSEMKQVREHIRRTRRR